MAFEAVAASAVALGALVDGASGGAVAVAAAVAAAVAVAVAVAVAAPADTVMAGTSVPISTLLTRVPTAPGVAVGTAADQDTAEVTERLASTLLVNLVSRSWSAMFVFLFHYLKVHAA